MAEIILPTKQAVDTLASTVSSLSSEMASVKKSVSDGKALVASAITAKRVETASDATFAQMAANINSITLGSGNATVGQVLSGATFTNNDGVEYTGTMPNVGSVACTITPSESAQSYTVPAGYHNGSGKVSVGAISSTYVGTGVTKITSNTSLTVSGSTVTVPSGYYASSLSKSIGAGSASISGLSIASSTGVVTATGSVTAGYVAAASPTKTLNLTTQAAQTITPGTASKTISSNRWLTGVQTIKGDANLVASNIKSGVTIFGVTGTSPFISSGYNGALNIAWNSPGTYSVSNPKIIIVGFTGSSY